MRKFWESIYSPNYITGYNPFILKDMNRAIERMVSAINNRQKIVVYGIPNVDGLCAISSLILVLKYLNADIEYIVHNESIEMSTIATKDIVNNVHFLGGELLITLGIGLDSNSEELCKKLGIDLIVVNNKNINRSYDYININPNQKGCQYRYKDLSISGVTFKLMQAVAIYYNVKSINKYIDLILIGEKSAQVINKGENAIILKEGMKFLKNTNNYGLRAIIDAYNIKEMDDEAINQIIEVITPSINVVTMMDNARIIIELLITNRKERAEQITKYLNKIIKNNV